MTVLLVWLLGVSARVVIGMIRLLFVCIIEFIIIILFVVCPGTPWVPGVFFVSMLSMVVMAMAASTICLCYMVNPLGRMAVFGAIV